MLPETRQSLAQILNDINVDSTRDTLHRLFNRWVTTTEPRWDDYVFPAQGLNPPGTIDDPTRDTDDGSLRFAADKDNLVAGNGQVPHSAVLDSYMHPHVHWLATTENTGDIVWKLEYKAYNIGDPAPAEWTSLEVVSPAAAVHAISYFDVIPTIYSKMSTIIVWRLSRVGTDPRDTYPDDVKLFSFDVHYQKNSFGSEEELVHTYGT